MKKGGRGRGRPPGGARGERPFGRGPAREDSRAGQRKRPGKQNQKNRFAGQDEARRERALPSRERSRVLIQREPTKHGYRDAERRGDRDDGAPSLERERDDSSPPETILSTVQNVTVGPDQAGMRIDRFLEAKFPKLSFAHIQRIVRKGELRVDGKRADSKDRLEQGQKVRIPPVRTEAPVRPAAERAAAILAEVKAMTLYEDDDVLVINKPFGLAVQGGSGTTRHVDGMLAALIRDDGQRPRLVHRLDKDTAGCLVIAKTRFAASTLAKTFRSRSARKIYWALVSGVPRVRQGRVSTYLSREEQSDGDSRMRVAKHGDDGASHALTYYAVVETSAQKLAWLSLKPVTGRTHQLRVHAAEIGHPIVGDPKYFNRENWQLPGGIQNRLHLLARRIVLPHPRGGKAIDVSAPLPPHMLQSWNLLGLDASRFDPIEEAPDG